MIKSKALTILVVCLAALGALAASSPAASANGDVEDGFEFEGGFFDHAEEEPLLYVEFPDLGEGNHFNYRIVGGPVGADFDRFNDCVDPATVLPEDRECDFYDVVRSSTRRTGNTLYQAVAPQRAAFWLFVIPIIDGEGTYVKNIPNRPELQWKCGLSQADPGICPTKLGW